MAHRGSRALAAVVAVVAVCAGAVGAEAQPDPVRVNATVSFDRKDGVFTKIRLTIKRNAVTWRSGPLGASYFSRPRILVRDLDADAEPEVTLDTYTGGAHCCSESRVFRYLPVREAYGGTFHGWGNVGYRPKNIDGRGPVELVSSDDRFAYVFTPFAASFFPLRLWHFEDGRFVDATDEFPAQIEADARVLWSEYLGVRGRQVDVRGVLAAWLADQYRLGREDEGWAQLETIRRRGELGPRPDLAGWPQGRSYFKALRAFLEKRYG